MDREREGERESDRERERERERDEMEKVGLRSVKLLIPRMEGVAVTLFCI